MGGNDMCKARIIKRTSCVGYVNYVIQQKHPIFWWKWIDGYRSSNSQSSTCPFIYFESLENAIKDLHYFDGSFPIDEVVYDNDKGT